MAARGVTATLNYLAPGSTRNRLYVAPGAHRSTTAYDERRVRIGDARARREAPTLDRDGFARLDHQSAVADFRDAAEVEAVYVPEAIGLLRALLGADLVVPLGWVLRSAAGDTRGAQPVAADVHVDVHPDRAPERFRRAYEEAAPGGPSFRRAVFTSLWRAFTPPPQDWPLALCDYRSVDDAEGVPNLMLTVDALPETVPEVVENERELPAASIFGFSPAHRWWYFPDLTRDEALVFKLHDSDHGVAWRVPHTAFRDEGAAAGTPRESIELRSMAFFSA